MKTAEYIDESWLARTIQLHTEAMILARVQDFDAKIIDRKEAELRLTDVMLFADGLCRAIGWHLDHDFLVRICPLRGGTPIIIGGPVGPASAGAECQKQ